MLEGGKHIITSVDQYGNETHSRVYMDFENKQFYVVPVQKEPKAKKKKGGDKKCKKNPKTVSKAKKTYCMAF